MAHLTGPAPSGTKKTFSSKPSKIFLQFRPSKKKQVAKTSGFSSKGSGKSSVFKPKSKSRIFSPRLPKSFFTARPKSTVKVSKFAKSSGGRPLSSFMVSSIKLSKDTPETSGFIASESLPKFKTGRVSKAERFSTAKIAARQPTQTFRATSSRIFSPTLPSSITGIIPGREQSIDSVSIPKNGTSLPPTPESTAGNQPDIFDAIADFFNNLFGVSGGSSSQDRAGDSGSITTIEFSPAILPSQNVIPSDQPGITEIVPTESLGLGIGGVPGDEGGDKDGILNSIVNDPVKLGLSITAIIGIIAGFTGGK